MTFIRTISTLSLILFISNGIVAQRLIFDSTYVSNFPFKFSSLSGCRAFDDSTFLIFGSIDEPFVPGSPKHMQRYYIESFVLDTSFKLKENVYAGISDFTIHGDTIFGCRSPIFKSHKVTFEFSESFMDSLTSDANILKYVGFYASAQYYIKETGKYIGGYDEGIVPYSDTITPGGFILYSINPNGTFDSGFSHDVDQSVLSIKPYANDSYLITGAFDHYDDSVRKKIVKIDPYGNLISGPTPFESNSYAPYVLEIQDDGKIILLGALILTTQPNDTFCIIRLNPDLTVDTSFHFQNFPYTYAASGISDITKVADSYLVVGFFDTFFGYERHNIARMDLNGNIFEGEFTNSGIDHCPHASLSPYASSADVIGNYVYVSGYFDGYNGFETSPLIRFRIVTDDVVEPHHEFDIFPNPTTGTFTLTCLQPGTVTIFDSKGKLANCFENYTSELTIDATNYESGLYFIKHDGQVQRIIKL